MQVREMVNHFRKKKYEKSVFVGIFIVDATLDQSAV